MNILVLYDEYSTFTNTVFDHLVSFRHHSKHKHYYCHGHNPSARVNWQQFDAVVIHYCLRVAFNHIPAELEEKITRFPGIKILFVQDEYDLTENTRKAIERLQLQMVFTCVPEAYRDEIYPQRRFPDVEFVSNLTGYVPPSPPASLNIPPIRDRQVIIAYRGRALPYFYGDLGQEKLVIAQRMRQACDERHLASDIEWDDEHRIYGENWPRFLMSAKATLGTESGCNLFDYDGGLRARVSEALATNPDASYEEVRKTLSDPGPERPIMNQISPRFFEAICFKTALILFEGTYSGILRPWEHFIPLRKDFSNLQDVFSRVADDAFLQALVDRAHRDIIESNKYTYESFVAQYDAAIEHYRPSSRGTAPPDSCGEDVTEVPLRSKPVAPPPQWLSRAWNMIPLPVRKHLQYRAVRLWMKVR